MVEAFFPEMRRFFPAALYHKERQRAIPKEQEKESGWEKRCFSHPL